MDLPGERHEKCLLVFVILFCCVCTASENGAASTSRMLLSLFELGRFQQQDITRGYILNQIKAGARNVNVPVTFEKHVKPQQLTVDVAANDREKKEQGHGRMKRSYKSEDFARRLEYSTSIPSDNIVVVCFGAPVRSLLNETTLLWLRDAFATYLHLPLENVGIDKIRYHGNIVELYFVKLGRPVKLFNMKEDLILAKDIVKPDLLAFLQRELPFLNITIVYPQHDLLISTYSTQFWMESYFPYVAAACSVSLVLITAVLIYCCCKKRQKEMSFDEKEDLPKAQQIFYPTIKPDVKNPMMVQPEGSPVFVTKGCVTPIQTQPMRFKAKGLLERRGSSASLTIDLNASPEMNRWEGSPPKESSGLEYLLSAGNRLSRRDLRNSVKNSRALYEEFWEIPMNHPEKVHVAGSGMKNRYRTIIPNENTRVVLPDSEWDPLSSYINANYIRGYEGERHAYIATQGPMSHTIVDFWRMIWNEKAPIIIMITKLKEKNKPKCENYLPEDHTWCTFGDIDVKVDRVINKQGYTLRHLLLRSKGEMQHVMHYWYTAWPDHKPPESPRMLLELIKEVELRRFRGDGIRAKGPVVVHCSAGIGRTGCFIAISTGIRQLREEHSVDLLGITCALRVDRAGMVQTHGQYEFIHQALCEYEKDLAEPITNSYSGQ